MAIEDRAVEFLRLLAQSGYNDEILVLTKRYAYTNSSDKVVRMTDTPSIFNWIRGGNSDNRHFSGLLPKGTRFVLPYDTGYWFVIEVPPGKFLMRTATMNTREGYRLLMPWQYFILNARVGPDSSYIYGSRLFWAKNYIKNLDEQSLIPALIPNVRAGDGSICLGSTYTDTSVGIVEKCNSFISQFYSTESRFNRDLGWHKPSAYRTYSKWAAEKDPLAYLFWRDWDTTRSWYKKSINQLIYRDGSDRDSEEPLINVAQISERIADWGW